MTEVAVHRARQREGRRRGVRRRHKDKGWDKDKGWGKGWGGDVLPSPLAISPPDDGKEGGMHPLSTPTSPPIAALNSSTPPCLRNSPVSRFGSQGGIGTGAGLGAGAGAGAGLGTGVVLGAVGPGPELGLVVVVEVGVGVPSKREKRDSRASHSDSGVRTASGDDCGNVDADV